MALVKRALIGAVGTTVLTLMAMPPAMAGDGFGRSAIGGASGRYTDAGDQVTVCGSGTRGGSAQLSIRQEDGSWVNKSTVRIERAQACNTQTRDVLRENALLRLEICDLTDYGAKIYCNTITFSGA